MTRSILDVRIALAIGAAGGIGKAIAQRLAAEGACVVIADLDLERARTWPADQAQHLRLLAAELVEHGIKVNGVNPDGVVHGSGTFASGRGANRALAGPEEASALGNALVQARSLGADLPDLAAMRDLIRCTHTQRRYVPSNDLDWAATESRARPTRDGVDG